MRAPERRLELFRVCAAQRPSFGAADDGISILQEGLQAVLRQLDLGLLMGEQSGAPFPQNDPIAWLDAGGRHDASEDRAWAA